MNMKLLVLLPDLRLCGEPGLGNCRLWVCVVRNSQVAWLETRWWRALWLKDFLRAADVMEVKEALLEERPLVLVMGRKAVGMDAEPLQS